MRFSIESCALLSSVFWNYTVHID